MRVDIHVTADDIKNGKRRIAGCCPIALATHRACGKPVYVGPAVMSVDGYQIALPYAAQDFIAEFDFRDWPHRIVKPFSFAIILPETL